MAVFSGRRGGGSGQGFRLGQAVNQFGTVTGTLVEAQTARDTYAAANPAWLASYDADPTVGIYLTYRTGGEAVIAPQSRSGGSWVNNAAFIAIQGQDGSGTDFSGIDPFEIPLIGSDGRPQHSGIRRTGAAGEGAFEFDETGIFPQESIQIGFSGVLSALGAVPLFRSFVTGRRGTFPFTYYDRATGTQRTVEVSAAGNNRVVSQPLSGDTITTGGSFQMATTSAEVISRVAFRLGSGSSLTGLRLRMTVQGQTEPFYYFPSKTLWDNQTGQDIADTGNTPNEVELDLIDAPLFLLGISDPQDPIVVNIEYEFTSGSLLGSGNAPYFEIDRNIVTLRDLAYNADTVDALGANVSGDQLTITVGRVGAADLMTSVTLPAGGGGTTPTDPVAQITRFNIAGQETSVLAGTTLSGTQTFNYNVNHPEDVNGNLSLQQGGTVLRTDISPSGSTFTQAITSTTLNSNQEVVFRLFGNTNEGILLSSVFRVRAHAPAEQLYYGLSASNNPDTVVVSGLRTTEAGIDGSTVGTPRETTAGEYFIILTPSDHDLTVITDNVLMQNVFDIFTRTVNVRTIGGISYNSYVVGALNAGVNENYTLTF